MTSKKTVTPQKAKKKVSPEAAKKKKAEYWDTYKDTYNERRKSKYAKDKNFRAKALAESRRTYRETNDVEERNSRDNLKNLDTIGKIRLISIKDRTRRMMTFTTAELAEAIGYSVLAVYRWQADGRLPKANIKIAIPQGTKGFMTDRVYTRKEVEAIAAIMSDHQKVVSQYRLSHHETRNKLKTTLQEIRKDVKSGKQ